MIAVGRTSFELYAALEMRRTRGFVVNTPFGAIDIDDADDYCLVIVCTGLGVPFTMEEPTEAIRARLYAWMRADWLATLVGSYEQRAVMQGRMQRDGELSS